MEKSEMSVRCVELVDGYGEWHVRVIEEDHEYTRSFEIESFAWATPRVNGGVYFTRI